MKSWELILFIALIEIIALALYSLPVPGIYSDGALPVEEGELMKQNFGVR